LIPLTIFLLIIVLRVIIYFLSLFGLAYKYLTYCQTFVVFVGILFVIFPFILRIIFINYHEILIHLWYLIKISPFIFNHPYNYTLSAGWEYFFVIIFSLFLIRVYYFLATWLLLSLLHSNFLANKIDLLPNWGFILLWGLLIVFVICPPFFF
jgi:hypothetical protein